MSIHYTKNSVFNIIFHNLSELVLQNAQKKSVFFVEKVTLQMTNNNLKYNYGEINRLVEQLGSLNIINIVALSASSFDICVIISSLSNQSRKELH